MDFAGVLRYHEWCRRMWESQGTNNTDCSDPVRSMCKVASKKMMDADYRGAYERYRSAELHVGADIGADAMEFAVFRFCLTYSKLKHQTTDVATVQDCIETFQELSLAFPLCGVCLLGHVGTCEAKKMLNFVKDYQALLDEGKELLESHDFTPVSYPGVDEVIVWSTAQGFKQYLDEWADLVKHQPEYVAKCMHTPCGAIKPEIYVSDLDFKGYVELKCTERCILQFHQSCWKQELKSKANASDTLGAQCWTPDCEGIIVVFKVIDEKNELSIHRSKEEVADKKKSKKQPKSHHQQQLQQKKTEQKKIEEAVKKGKKEKKKGRVGDDHSSDEEKEEPEKHVALEQEAKHAPKAKEDLPQQQPPQSKQQQQQQQQQQAQPAGATAAPNPGEVPWESMKRVKRSDDEDEKKEEQPRGGKKDKKKKRGKQQPAVNPQQLFRIEFTGPKRQLISADGEVLGRDQEEGDQAESASARPANAGSAPSPLPAGFSSGYSAMGGTPPPGRPHEDSKLMHELAVLVKSLMDHMRANGATPLAKLEEFVADCDHEVQVHIADKGGLKAYLSHAIAVEFYDGYVALPGDRDRVKQTFTALWKMNNVFKDHILGSLEEGAEGEDYGNLVRADSPYEEIADEGEDSEEGESDMVARAGKECGAEGNVESAVNAALDEVEQEMLEEQAAAPAVGAAGGEPAADRFDKKLSDEQEDDMFQELLNERLSALGTLKIQLDEAKKERTRFLEQKAAQEQDIKRLEEGSKTKTNELKRVIESYEARAHLNKETAAAYASELLEIQAHVAEIERKLKEAQKNRFFSDGEELTIERARRRLRITRELEDQLRQELDKAEFVRLQAYLLGDIQDGAKDDRESLSKDEAVRAGREPDIPRVREEGGHPPLSALLGKLQLKSQNQGSGQQLQQGQYQAGTGPARPLPKTADEFLSFVMPKNTSTQMAPPGLAGAQLQQAAVRPAPADPTIAAFRPFQAANPAPADPTIASMWPVAASTGPAYNVGESGAFGGAALDPIAQLQQQLQAQQQMQALMQLQQQQQQFMQAAGGAGYVAQSVDPTSATLSMAAAKISTLSTAQGVVSPSAASRGQEPQVQASAAGAGAVTGTSKLMDRIVFPLVRETGLAQDIVLGAIMAVKSRRGKLTGLSQEELRATLLDVLVEQGHIRVAGAPPPPAPARPPVVLRPAPVPQASVWNVDGRYSSPVRFTGETITECVICREPLNALQKEKLACGHEYHAVCVKEWFNRKASCPLCNRHVVLESDYPSLK